LCKEFGWTEEEVNNTSMSFVNFCIEQLKNDNERDKNELNKIKRNVHR
jgi:hypothetical protein